MARVLCGGEFRKFFRSARGGNGRLSSENDGRTWSFPGHLDWFTWRIVHKGWATYAELERDWSCEALQDAHDALDAIEKAEYDAHREAAERSRRR